MNAAPLAGGRRGKCCKIAQADVTPTFPLHKALGLKAGCVRPARRGSFAAPPHRAVTPAPAAAAPGTPAGRYGRPLSPAPLHRRPAPAPAPPPALRGTAPLPP